MYKRVLIKLSGELLGGSEKGLNESSLSSFANVIDELYKSGVKVAILTGGGNIVRGRDFEKNVDIDRAGMLATAVNGLTLKSFINSPCEVMSSIPLGNLCEYYEESKALKSIDNNVLILTCGTGIPHFSTDTASVLRAIDIKADVVLKATKSDGVFDKNPDIYEDAVKYDKISYEEMLEKKITMIDLAASVLAMENNMEFLVFSAKDPKNIFKAVKGKAGTRIFA